MSIRLLASRTGYRTILDKKDHATNAGPLLSSFVLPIGLTMPWRYVLGFRGCRVCPSPVPMIPHGDHSGSGVDRIPRAEEERGRVMRILGESGQCMGRLVKCGKLADWQAGKVKSNT